MIITINSNSKLPKFGSLTAEECAEILDEHYVSVDEKNTPLDPMSPLARFLSEFDGNLLDLLASFCKKEVMSEEDSKTINEALSFYYKEVIPEWKKIRNKRGFLGNTARWFLNIL